MGVANAICVRNEITDMRREGSSGADTPRSTRSAATSRASAPRGTGRSKMAQPQAVARAQQLGRGTCPRRRLRVKEACSIACLCYILPVGPFESPQDFRRSQKEVDVGLLPSPAQQTIKSVPTPLISEGPTATWGLEGMASSCAACTSTWRKCSAQ